MSTRIEFEGATNFRDLGGYRGAEGRVIRPGRVFRSDALYRLTPGDRTRVSDLGVRWVCDLRYPDERTREPSLLPDGVEILPVGLTERPTVGAADALDVRGRTEANARAYLAENYRQYPHLYSGAYRTVLETLLRDEGGVVFHCTAGKDRAGFTAVVVLKTLGVDDDTIRDDYLLTNQYWDRGDRAPEDWPKDVVEAVFTARLEYLEAALEVIQRDFGSFEDFLHGAVGFTPDKTQRLRALLLAED